MALLGLVGQLPGGPVVDRPAGLLGRLTGAGHELDDLLGAESGRGARAGGVGEHLRDQGQQGRFGSLRLRGLLELGGGLAPAVAPVADGPARQAQPPGGGLDAGVGREGEQDRGPADEALVRGLAAGEALEQGLLRRGNRKRKSLGVPHGPPHAASAGECHAAYSTAPGVQWLEISAAI